MSSAGATARVWNTVSIPASRASTGLLNTTGVPSTRIVPASGVSAPGVQRRTALVGFDDVALADVLDPPVTVVAQDVAQIGALAAKILFRRIDGDPSDVQTHIVPVSLIPRGSGEIRPAAGQRE